MNVAEVNSRDAFATARYFGEEFGRKYKANPLDFMAKISHKE